MVAFQRWLEGPREALVQAAGGSTDEIGRGFSRIVRELPIMLARGS